MSSQDSSSNDSDGTNTSSLPTSSTYPSSGSLVVPKSHFKSQEDEDLIRLALHKSPFFTCLDEEQIERFVRTAHKEAFAPGSIVILEGCVDDDANDGGDESFDDSDSSSSSSSISSTSRLANQQPPQVALIEEQVSTTDPGDCTDTALEDVDTETSTATNSTVLASQDAVADTKEFNETNARETDDPSTNQGDTLREEEYRENGSIKESTNDKLDKQLSDAMEQAVTTTADSSSLPLVPNTSISYVPAPRSGRVRALYIIRRGKADVWYQHAKQSHSSPKKFVSLDNRPHYIQPHAMGPGTLFGEGGFLFGRQHSASVVAARAADENLECWVVELPTFRDYVLLSDNMKLLFQQFASIKNVSKQGEEENTSYMTLDDFMKSCENEQMESSADILSAPFPTSAAAQTDPWARARVANTLQLLQPSRRGKSDQRISLSDFCWFYFLLARPDPEVDIAFLLMDQRQTGSVGLPQVAALVEPVFPGTDYESDFFRRYFGEDGQQSLRLAHFSQFFSDLHQELGRQVFMRASSPTNGYLEPTEFVAVLRTALGWRLPLSMMDRLESLYCRGPFEAGEAAARVSMLSGSLHQEDHRATAERTKVSVLAEMEQCEKGYGDRIFSYSDFLAFQEVITNLPGICNLIDRAQEIKKEPLSPDDFKVANRVLGMGGRLSRRQVDIVFALFDLDKDGYISHQDTISVCGVDFAKRLIAVEGRNGKLTFAPPPEYRPPESPEEALPNIRTTHWQQIARGLEYFGVTAFAGALGTICLYPVDLVKTRLMNQRMERKGTRMYKGFFDCLQRAFVKEGFLGLYRGLTPQLLGLAPEKMIKLQVNDLLRKAFSTKDKETGKPVINLPLETLAGAVSGACQLLVTNPMELTKIRMQMQGETARVLAERGWAISKPHSFNQVVRGLGFPGVYLGASACLLRDIFFGALYFPTYAWCKDQLASRNEIPGYTTPFDLLTAGTLAGIPAAFLTTPFDVVKTRIQTLPRPEESVYVGIRDCAKRIYTREGLGGFFLGAGARVLRIAPQFGITLLTYESLTEATGTHRRSVTPAPPTNAFVEPYDYRTAFPVRSLHTKTTEISNFMETFGQGHNRQTRDNKDEKKN